MADIEITCADCRTSFIHDERNQAFYAQNGFSPPKRCKPCRDIKKQQREVQNGGGYADEGDARPQHRRRG